MPYERSREIEERFGKVVSLIQQGRGNTGQLASALSVSRPTVHRVISELRRRGYGVRSIRDSDGWKYEITDMPSLDKRREASQ